MMTFLEAKRKALNTISAEQNQLAILDDSTIEREYGWIFFYTSQKYIETQDVRYALAGNSPIVVDKNSGEIDFLRTSVPVAIAIAEYEKSKYGQLFD